MGSILPGSADGSLGANSSRKSRRLSPEVGGGAVHARSLESSSDSGGSSTGDIRISSIASSGNLGSNNAGSSRLGNTASGRRSGNISRSTVDAISGQGSGSGSSSVNASSRGDIRVSR